MIFKIQIVSFNEREYNRAIVEANKKIKRLKEALKWCSSFIMTSNIDKVINVLEDILTELKSKN